MLAWQPFVADPHQGAKPVPEGQSPYPATERPASGDIQDGVKIGRKCPWEAL
jgi:hypothetical protein